MNYFFIIFIPTILYFLESISRRNDGLFEKIGIAFLIIISSIRYGFGSDFFTYQDVFNKLSKGIELQGFEIGFVLLNKFLGIFNLPFNALLFVISCFNFTLLYLALKRIDKRYRWMSIFLYLSYFDLHFYSLSAIRQSIVMSIFIYSYRYIEEKKVIKYIMWIIFAQFFHRTAFILIPIYFVYQIYINISWIKKVIYFFVYIAIYNVFIDFLPIIREYMSDRLEYYLFLDTSNNIDYNYGYVFFLMLLIIFLILFLELLNQKNKNFEYKFCFFSVIVFLVLKEMQYIDYYSIIPRIQLYFYSLYIFAIPEILKLFENKSQNIITCIIVQFMLINFAFRYNEINNTYEYMYYGKYRTIFDTE